MHIFLTGEIQIGKSTAIDKTLALLRIIPGGFRTYFGPDRKHSDKSLYLNSAGGPKLFREENAVVRFSEGQPPQILADKFDIFGTELISSARVNSNLILMDECGSFERDALMFQREILNTLEGPVPVLGVIKMASRGWTDTIRNHPKVKLLTVTKENRDALPQVLSHSIRTFL